MNPVAFEIFWLKIYRYWLVYFFSFLFFYIYFHRFIKKEKININIDDLFFLIWIWVLLWWRIWHVLYNIDYYIEKPYDIIAIQKWWMAFVWWFIWWSIGFLIYAYKYKINKKIFFKISDEILKYLPFSIFFWRIANMINKENLWIYIWNKWIFSINWYLNLPLIEAILEWIIIWIILLFFKKTWQKTAIFLISYWIIRFIIEFFRNYNANEYILFFTKTQYFMIIFIIIWIFILRIRY